jgi:hypothetical protein
MRHECEGCGAPMRANTSTCEYCKRVRDVAASVQIAQSDNFINGCNSVRQCAQQEYEQLRNNVQLQNARNYYGFGWSDPRGYQ